MPNPALTELLASYVPRLIQNRVIANPEPIESPVAEDIQAAVLFADISGFTSLTERLAESGPAGGETIARILNDYFGQLIDIVHEYGGDVVKFAGDAVIAIWNIATITSISDPVSRSDQWQWTMRATECALAIRERLTNYKAEGSTLYLKLALSSGHLTTAHVGGEYKRWEFLLTGNPLVELGIANSLAKAGDIIVTPSAWRLIRNDSIAEPLEFELKDAIAQGARLNSLNKPSSMFVSNQKIDIPTNSENSLRAYIPGAIINRLTAGQSAWIAELRRVTVLFINLPGINQNTELSDSQNLARHIQQSVYRYEGSVNKINVDDKGITIIAALGLPPFSHEDDPSRGIQAAMMIRKRLQGLNVRCNIGVTTGRIFCGSIGNDTRREYTIIGNAVNLSARLMSASKDHFEITEKYGVVILCDRPTYDGAKEAAEFEILPPQQIKGRSEPVEVFHPVALKKSVIRPTTELIGRQEEKTLIANFLQELSRGAPHHTIILQGEMGIGKTRLFEDLVRQAESLRVHMYNSSGDTIEKLTLFHVWRPIFNKIFQIDNLLANVESLDEMRAVIEKQVTERLEEIDPDLARYTPLLDAILPIQIPDNELTSAMTGEIRASNLRELLTSILQSDAQRAPLLLVLEDLHWFDSASWSLLVDVQQKVRPLMLALNTRPLSDPVPVQFQQLVDFPETKLIKLEAMLLDDVESLVCQRLGVRSVPPLIGRLIREKSEGHPFFAEELAFALRETGVLLIENQECRINSRLMTYEDLVLPDSLQAAITNRIDSLDPSQQLTLKVASVIGRIFTYRILEAIHPIEADRKALPDYLDTLTRLSLTLVESETPDLAYIFKHAITQEVAYNLMLYSQRRQLHQRVAEWIEEVNQGKLEAFYPLLAHHWTLAAEIQDTSSDPKVVEKAVDYLEKAGEQAMEAFASREAIQFFNQALEWESKLPVPLDKRAIRERNIRRARWLSRLGLAHYASGSLPDCERNVRQALQIMGKPIPNATVVFVFGFIWQVIRQSLHRYFPAYYMNRAHGIERDAAIEVGRMYELMSRMYFYSNQTLPILFTALRFLNEVEKAGPSHELASAYAGLGVMGGFAQLHPLAERYVVRALDVAHAVDKPATFITTNIVTSVYHMSVGKWDDVLSKAQSARDYCEELGDYRQWGDALSLIGEGAFLSGNIKLGLMVQKELLEDARRRNSPLHTIWGLAGVATNLIRQGEHASGAVMFEEAVQILAELPNRASSINAHALLALAYYRMGDKERALFNVNESMNLAEGTSPTNYALLIGFTAVAEVCFSLWEMQQKLAVGDFSQYKSLAERSLQILRTYKGVFPIGQAFASYYQGLQDLLMGKKEAAMKSWKTGLGAAQKFKLIYEEGIIRVRLGINETDANARLEHFNQAMKIFESMGAEYDLRNAKEIAKQTK